MAAAWVLYFFSFFSFIFHILSDPSTDNTIHFAQAADSSGHAVYPKPLMLETYYRVRDKATFQQGPALLCRKSVTCFLLVLYLAAYKHLQHCHTLV